MRVQVVSAIVALCYCQVASAQILGGLLGAKPATTVKSTSIPAAAAATVKASSAAAVSTEDDLAPALPITDFLNTPKFSRPLTVAEAAAGVNATVTTIKDNVAQIKALIPTLQFPSWTSLLPNLPIRDVPAEPKARERKKRQSTCSNPRIRVEWDNLSNADRQAYITAIKCLQSRPSQSSSRIAKSRYEDLVVLHQTLTPIVHGNAKFLLWHRYYLYTFENALRRECSFTRPLPWFDETKYAGRYASSSIFSPQWYGTFAAGGNCVRNGQFANLTINIGPGANNVRHCLSRDGQDFKTANTNRAIVDACNARSTYANMAACAEGGAHAWGHNGIGAVMQDTYAAPADPVFWLHHAFIDRNLAQWQSVSSQARTSTVGGRDQDGRTLTLNYLIQVNSLSPDTAISNLLNTLSPTLCYRYDY